jgi:hypothetical protein
MVSMAHSNPDPNLRPIVARLSGLNSRTVGRYLAGGRITPSSELRILRALRELEALRRRETPTEASPPTEGATP